MGLPEEPALSRHIHVVRPIQRLRAFAVLSVFAPLLLARTVFGIYGPMLEQCGVYDRDPGQHRRDLRLAVFRI